MRMKEQVAGRLVSFWKEDLLNGRSKTCAVFLDGLSCQNVLTAEAWTDADQAHAELHLKPHLGDVVALENGKIVGKGKSTVFHGKQIKLAYDRLTIVKKVENKENYGLKLPLVTIPQCSGLRQGCAISLVVCIQRVTAPQERKTAGGERAVTNLQVAFEDRQIDCAFWGRRLADQMGQAKKGDVYRLDWMTLSPVGANQFKLSSNNGTHVQEVHGAEADEVRNALKETLTSMSPQFGMSRSDKMNLNAARVTLAYACHIKGAEISPENSNAYKGAVIVPCCFVKEIRSLGDSGLAYYAGCPQCKKAVKSDGTCAEHGRVAAIEVTGVAVILQDPSGTLEMTLWKEAFEALRSECGVVAEVEAAEVLPLLAQKMSACQFVARMAVGMNKSGRGHYVDLFDLSPAVSADGVLESFREMPLLPGDDGDGVAPLCCRHLHRDEMGQLQAKFGSNTRVIGAAMCLFRVCAEPEAEMVPEVEGLIVKVEAECCVCKDKVILQQAGIPSTVQKLNRMCVDELAFANVMLQSNGNPPFEVLQLQVIKDQKVMHEKLHKYQASQYVQFATGEVKTDITNSPCTLVQDILATPRPTKRLKVRTTNECNKEQQ